jgi:peptide chain release factor 1
MRWSPTGLTGSSPRDPERRNRQSKSRSRRSLGRGSDTQNRAGQRHTPKQQTSARRRPASPQPFRRRTGQGITSAIGGGPAAGSPDATPNDGGTMATASEILTKLRPKLDEFEAQRTELVAKSQDAEVYSNPAVYAPIARELGRLNKILERYDSLKQAEAQIEEAEGLAGETDEEIRELAGMQLAEAQETREALVDELLRMLVLADEISERNAIMEIRAGTGGDEAGLFAGDLLKMYLKYAEIAGFNVEMLDADATEVGGYKNIVARVTGESVFAALRYESGTHRVQRVPATETQGRIHTSAATVAVLPEAEEVDVEIAPDDYVKETYCAGGKGGQHVNRTESAVRLTHKETGIVVAIQDERSQHKNFARALQVLRARLYDHYKRKADEERGAARKSQVGTGDRSQKIRTYNWPQNRVTDHRIGQNYSLEQIIAGDLRKLVTDLQDADQAEQLAAL